LFIVIWLQGTACKLVLLNSSIVSTLQARLTTEMKPIIICS